MNSPAWGSLESQRRAAGISVLIEAEDKIGPGTAFARYEEESVSEEERSAWCFVTASCAASCTRAASGTGPARFARIAATPVEELLGLKPRLKSCQEASRS